MERSIRCCPCKSRGEEQEDRGPFRGNNPRHSCRSLLLFGHCKMQRECGTAQDHPSSITDVVAEIEVRDWVLSVKEEARGKHYPGELPEIIYQGATTADRQAGTQNMQISGRRFHMGCAGGHLCAGYLSRER
ncbi:hypothetical protein SKAU_G00071480 [Synaphobranchus kaupii]|uniref:Uncharacterized protein n=1 Tax=Synaphobranchus kaupii TaxID=118154 RepID=A0A9Q1G6T1_SYNKA|nr:hypothetical protein SKAU_G00071480 [Synaphobranchus kaupii]